MSPDVFDGIQFRRIGRQPKGMDSFLQTRQEIVDEAAAMRGQSIPDDQQLARNNLKEFFQEDYDLRAFNGVCKQLEVQFPSAQAGNQRQILPVEVMKQDGRLAARRPGTASVRLLGKPTFVNENNGSTFR